MKKVRFKLSDGQKLSLFLAGVFCVVAGGLYLATEVMSDSPYDDPDYIVDDAIRDVEEAEKDQVDCEAYAEKLLTAGDAQKMYEGAMYLERLSEAEPSQDCRKQSLPLLQKAADMQMPGAMFQLGRIYTEDELDDIKKGTSYLVAASELNDSNALVLLAARYELGVLAPSRPDKAWSLYLQAAELGNAVAAKRVMTVNAVAEAFVKKNKVADGMTPELQEKLRWAFLKEISEGKDERQVYRDIVNEVNEKLGVLKGRRFDSVADIINSARRRTSSGLLTRETRPY